jgi:nitronate monooxygenase
MWLTICRGTVIEDTRPQVVSFHFCLPDAVFLNRIKAAGCRITSSATTVEEALWLEARGVDVVIAKGSEAGGHWATFLGADPTRAVARQPSTMALVPQVVDVVKVPIAAAGGIADGRGIVAAFALGSAGAQIVTAYLLRPEAATTQIHREALSLARGHDPAFECLYWPARTCREQPLDC